MTCDRRAMVPAIPRPYKEREDALDFSLVQFAHIALQSSPFNMTSPAIALLKDFFVVTFLSPIFLIFDSTKQAVLFVAVTLQFQFSVQMSVALPVVLESAPTIKK